MRRWPPSTSLRSVTKSASTSMPCARAGPNTNRPRRRSSHSGAQKKHTDAADISDGLGATAFDNNVGALDTLTEKAFAAGSAAGQHASKVYSQTRIAVLALLSCALLLGLGMAVLIPRQVQRQLGGEPRDAALAVQAVSTGDLCTPITVVAGGRREPDGSHSSNAGLAVGGRARGPPERAKRGQRRASRSPAVTKTCRSAPSSRPARWSRPPRRWSNGLDRPAER